MAEYIDREKVLNYRETVRTDDYSGNEILDVVLTEEILGLTPANVIGCSEYEKLRLVNLDLAETNKGLLAEHKELVELRSKIDEAIEEIKNIDPIYSAIGDRVRFLKNCDDIKAEVVEILKRI